MLHVCTTRYAVVTASATCPSGPCRVGDLNSPSDLVQSVEELLVYLNSAPIVWEFDPVLLFNKSKSTF